MGKEFDDRAFEMTAECNGYLGQLPTLSGLQVADPGMADWLDGYEIIHVVAASRWHGICRVYAEESKPHVQLFCTPWNLGAVLEWVDAGLHTATVYLAGVEEANLFACVVAAEVDGPRASV
jgi:hypothetical protein